MDSVLRGIFSSSHPSSVKAALIEKVRDAAHKTSSCADVCSVLNCCKEFILESDDLKVSNWSKLVFTSWASCNRSAFQEFFSEALLNELLLSSHKNIPGAIWILHEGLSLLKNRQTGTYAPTCSKISQWATNFIRDNSDFDSVVGFCKVLLDHAGCIPPAGSHQLCILCSTLLRVISQFDCPSDSRRSKEFFSSIPGVLGKLLQQIWSQDSAALRNSLRTVVDVICYSNKPDGIMAIGGVVQLIPNEVMQPVVWSEATSATLDDEMVIGLLDRMIHMLTWPNVQRIDTWVVSYMRGLASVGRYNLLSQFTCARISQLFEGMLDHPEVYSGIFPVVSYMLFSHQCSPVAFHKIVGQIPHLVEQLRSDQRFPTSALSDVVELLHCLMFQHSGFPDLYGPIVDTIKEYISPSVEFIRQKLAEYAWTKDMTFQVATLESIGDENRSETGFIGLCNLGNTCYINSILQTLYMCESFRRSVMLSVPKASQSVLSSLQEVFAFLKFTQRSAYAPENFVKVSRPRWFEAGHQHDCSEFLRHLLNVLRDQESSNKSESAQSSEQSDADHDSSMICRLFTGYTMTSYLCLGCRTRSLKKESFMDLQLAFPLETPAGVTNRPATMAGGNSSSSHSELDGHVTEQGSGSISLKLLIEHFLQTEKLDGANQYMCESVCNCLQNAERSTKIVSAPPYLVMTLLRFSYEAGRHTKKLIDVQYPLSIEIPVVQHDGDSMLPDSRTYGLVAVVIHSGLSSDHGHYYCYARTGQLTSNRTVLQVENDPDTEDHFDPNWFLFNDCRVTKASFNEFRNVSKTFNRDTAYLLVYRSVDSARVQQCQSSNRSDLTQSMLNAYLREIIDRDNERYLEELQKRRKVRPSFTAQLGQRSSQHDDDDDGPPPPSSCGNSGIGSFLQGPPSIC